MKSKMNILIILLTLLVSACATIKTPLPDTGNKDEGRVNLTYSYGLFEKPQVNWDQALVAATGQCKQWGYSPASKASGPIDECIRRDQNNNCIQHLVTTSYQCQLSTAQLKVQDDKIKKAAEVEKAKAEEFAKEYPYIATFTCSIGNNILNLAPCLQSSNGTKTELELTNGADYGLYNIIDYTKIGKDTNEGVIVPLRANFEIKIQNARESNKLTLTIKKTDTGEQIFIKSVAGWGKIKVGN